MSREVMYAIGALVAIIAIVLLMSKTREGLENVPGKIEFDDPLVLANRDRMLEYFLMAPQDMQNDFVRYVLSPEYKKASPRDVTPEMIASFELQTMLRYFYESVYKPATNPITEADIATFLDKSLANGNNIPQVYEKHIENGNIAKFLKAVFIDQVAPPKPKPASEPLPPVSIQTPTDFGQATELYRQNYIQYKTTGRAEYKTAYETAQAWIEQYLQSMEKRVTDGRQSITSFIKEYAGSGTTLGELNAKMQTIKKEGPASQDKYITIKRINQDVPEDNTNLYVKVGIAAALVGIAGVMSVF